MKFDKETIAALIVCVVILFAWSPFCKWMGWIPQEKTTENVATVTEAAPTAEASQDKKTSLRSATPASQNDNLIAAKHIKKDNFKPQIIKDQEVNLQISPISGAIAKVDFVDYLKSDKKSNIELVTQNSPYALEVYGATTWQVLNINANSPISPSKYLLSREIKNSAGHRFNLTQTWQLQDDYLVDYAVEIKNLENSELDLKELNILGNFMPPTSQMTGDEIRRESHTVDYYTVAGKFADVDAAAKVAKFTDTPSAKVKWSAVSNKYFTALLVPQKPFDILLKKRVEKLTDTKSGYYEVAAGGSYANVKIAPQGEVKLGFKYYCGPKVLSQLVKADSSASKLMHLAWGPLDWLARFLLSALIWLKAVCGSYGWSIIIITVVVRLLFWPITQKANSSMKRMQVLQPKIKELREKYKNDPQVMNAKVMELYRQAKVNPLGGCLPILLQIPVFIALYQTLDGAIELRQVAFWWAADLAKPDTIAVIMGLPLNPLILAMVALMVVQQRLTPSAMDPSQQKMMLLMPLVMLFFLYNLPSGLTLYWTVSQALSIVQLLLQRKYSSGENPVKTG